MLFKIVTVVSFITSALSGLNHDPIGSLGGELDSNNCLIGAGYSWCEASDSCIRRWITPCEDYYTDCNDCLSKQRSGNNLACPIECDNIVLGPGPMLPRDPLPPSLPPSLPPTPVPISFHTDYDDSSDIGSECPIPDIVCDNQFVCPKVTEITHCSQGGINGYTTYQLSLLIMNPYVKNIYAIYGDNVPSVKAMIFPPAYQGSNIFNNNIGGLQSQIIDIDPDSRYDSWLTIGITDGDILNRLSSIGIDFDSWTENSGIYITNGAVFLTDPTIDLGDTEYIIAQLTLPNDAVTDVIINVQGKLNCDNCLNGLQNTWNQEQIIFHLEKPQTTVQNEIPMNCNTWFDGCNTCRVNKGQIGGCTRMMCFQEDQPRCLSYEQTTGH